MPDARAIQRTLMARQRAWADSHGIELASEISLSHWRDNLLAPIARECEAALAPDAPAADGPAEKPGRLHALDSGLALAINVFEPWRDRASELAARMPAWFPDDGRLRFGVRLPEGLTAAGPAFGIDVLIESDVSGPTALIPLFGEPFDDVDPRVRDPFGHTAIGWGELHGCGLLARDLHCHPRRFGRLDVGRLIETALALVRRYGHDAFRIGVIWFDAGGHASRRFRRELSRVRMRVGGEFSLLETSWQEVFSGLLGDADTGSGCADDDGYSRRIRDRYVAQQSACETRPRA